MLLSKMILERVHILIIPLAILALDILLISMLCFNMSVYAGFVNIFLTVRTFNVAV